MLLGNTYTADNMEKVRQSAAFIHFSLLANTRCLYIYIYKVLLCVRQLPRSGISQSSDLPFAENGKEKRINR
jgi:hypothetical protein